MGSLAAIDCATYAETDVLPSETLAAPPLLGERAGVRVGPAAVLKTYNQRWDSDPGTHRFCSTTVRPSSFALVTFCFSPPGQVISMSSKAVVLPRPMVTGNSDCEK